nr:chloride channel protein [Lacticaseibacillus daqingensis]
MPKPLGLIRAELAHDGRTDYRFVGLQLLLPAVILTSGTSLGPEATLVSCTLLFGQWLTEKLAYLTAGSATNTRAWWRAALAPHRGLAPTARLRWAPRTVAFLAVGLTAFYWTCRWGGEPSVRVMLGASRWGHRELALLLPLIVLGWCLGHLEKAAMMALRQVLLGRVRQTGALIVVGGVAIYAATLWLPAINFSGMANFQLLATSWPARSVGFLALAAGLKLALLTICLNTGWLGGDIFPVLFATTAQGLALSHLMPGVDALFVVAVLAISAGATILGEPLVAGGVMAALFLPGNLALISVATTALMSLLERRSGPPVAWVRRRRLVE